MFRYERPQKGRLRQFHQIDIELLGVPGPQGDVEIIACGHAILRELGFADRITLEINSLGDAASRQAYRAKLVEYFRAHEARLSADSKERLGRNPLRILDSKDAGDRRIVAEAPLFEAFLNRESRDFFAAVKAGLEALGIPYKVSPRLVRGLDYYCHTAFEFTTETLGAQGTVMGGGRYDGLIETMGGPPTPGCGWAAGIERLAMMLGEVPPARRPIAVLPVGAEAETKALVLGERLRCAGFAVELGYSGNLGRRMKRADKLNASAAIILGEDEIKRNAVTLRDLDSGAQEEVALDALEDRLAPYR
jgi:histidyl-tRNA synthetase